MPFMARSGLIATLTTVIAILFTASFATLASADILQFGPGGLPNCAYQCQPLWSAQYGCHQETVAGECFCKSKYLDILYQGGGGSLCEANCPETSGGAEVRAWYKSVCASFLNKQTTTSDTPTTTTQSQNPTNTRTTVITSPTATNNIITSIDQAESRKAVEWWKKNWYWFLLAFLLITIPIAAYALWFPCRKWIRRQVIRRRSRPSLPPVDPRANGGIASPEIPPIPLGAFTHEQLADPFSPSLTRDRAGYFPHYVTPASPTSAGGLPTPPMPSGGASPEPAGPAPMRQGSWERRMRGEYEEKNTIGERLVFWKRTKKRDPEGGGEQREVDASQVSASK